jgi:hypothetical protein
MHDPISFGLFKFETFCNKEKIRNMVSNHLALPFEILQQNSFPLYALGSEVRGAVGGW